ncbi:hypothetical protein N7448_003493 [Penicillium atrosanguineum]|nr:hypothetical protein N7448_003493 [Penicillium atrosanguineum]
MAQDPGSLETSEARGRILTITKPKIKIKKKPTVVKTTTVTTTPTTAAALTKVTGLSTKRTIDLGTTTGELLPQGLVTNSVRPRAITQAIALVHDSSRRYCGGRSRDNNQNQSLQQQQPVPVTSRYRSIDEPDLFDEPIEPVAPILGSDGMYYDAEGDTIIEDAPEVDLVAIVTQGTVEMAKITQSLLEQIAAFG